MKTQDELILEQIYLEMSSGNGITKRKIDEDGDLDLEAEVGHLFIRAFQTGELSTWEFSVKGRYGQQNWEKELTGFGVYNTLRLLEPIAQQMKSELEKNGVVKHTFSDSESRRQKIWPKLIPWIKHLS